MARKKKQECKEAPAWLTSFGDLMSLLLTFFILLYSMSVISLEKFNLSIQGITEAFGGRKMVAQHQLVKGQKVSLDFPDMYPKVKNGKKIRKKLNATLEKLREAGIDGEIEAHGTMMRLRLFTDNMFAPGSATPSEAVRPLISDLAAKLKPSELRMEIEGHTDSSPIRSARFGSNWALSAARAVSVLRLFKAAGYDVRLLSAKGAGEYHPIDSNDTPQGRMRNRR
ncbi:MAG TPA: flagellar motor protein MotB, partial [Sulfuricurvum sp.]|nr:flagellar motor protein MotB [Sulfuricurvum sp.]